MSKLKRELLNILFIGAGASLIHAAYEAANAKFNPLVWAVIVMGIAVALGGYVVFEYMVTAEERAEEATKSTAAREDEWLKRVGTPARLEPIGDGKFAAMALQLLRTLKSGSDVTFMIHIPRHQLELASYADFAGSGSEAGLKVVLRTLLELVDTGTIREYRRIICFDHGLFSESSELKSGTLKVGNGPDKVWGFIAEHCRQMVTRKKCSVYVAPAIVQNDVFLYGSDKAGLTLKRFDSERGILQLAYGFFFSDPPNSEIIEELRLIIRDTEKRMVAVHTIVDDDAPTVAVSS